MPAGLHGPLPETAPYAPPMRTWLVRWKVGKSLYVVPVLFATAPFLAGEIGPALQTFVFAAIGIYALTAAIEGQMEAALPWPARPVLAGLGLALLWPLDWHWHLAAAVAVRDWPRSEAEFAVRRT